MFLIRRTIRETDRPNSYSLKTSRYDRRQMPFLFNLRLTVAALRNIPHLLMGICDSGLNCFHDSYRANGKDLKSLIVTNYCRIL